MAASRRASRPLNLRRIAEPARDPIRILAQAYDYLIHRHSGQARTEVKANLTHTSPPTHDPSSPRLDS